jgi:hypothetical protein
MEIFFNKGVDKKTAKEDFLKIRLIALFSDFEISDKDSSNFLLTRISQMLLTYPMEFLDIHFRREMYGKEETKKIVELVKEFRNNFENTFSKKINLSFEEFQEERINIEKIFFKCLSEIKEIIGKEGILEEKYAFDQISENINQEIYSIKKFFNEIQNKYNLEQINDQYLLLMGKEYVHYDVKSNNIIALFGILAKNDIKKGFIKKDIHSYIEERGCLFYNFKPSLSSQKYFFEKDGIIFENKRKEIDFKDVHKIVEEKQKKTLLYFLRLVFRENSILLDIEKKVNKINIDIFKNVINITREIYLEEELRENKKVTNKVMKKI